MKFSKTSIEGLIVIEPQVFGDHRGYFIESYHQEKFKEAGIINTFVQDNESRSTKGVLRGLHFQLNPYSQAKLVRVIEGEVLDVAVDLRKGSPSYGKHESVILSAENKKQFFVPRGFAHGFVVLSDSALFSYKCDNLYNKEHEGGLLYNDPELGIDWKMALSDVKLSEKDKVLPTLDTIEHNFSIDD